MYVGMLFISEVILELQNTYQSFLKRIVVFSKLILIGCGPFINSMQMLF